MKNILLKVVLLLAVVVTVGLMGCEKAKEITDGGGGNSSHVVDYDSSNMSDPRNSLVSLSDSEFTIMFNGIYSDTVTHETIDGLTEANSDLDFKFKDRSGNIYYLGTRVDDNLSNCTYTVEVEINGIVDATFPVTVTDHFYSWNGGSCRGGDVDGFKVYLQSKHNIEIVVKAYVEYNGLQKTLYRATNLNITD